MISFAWKRIRNQKFKSFLTIFSLVTVFLIISYGIQTSKETKITVIENIEKYSRGTFDILLRPSDARTDVEKSLQTVEENYLGEGAGGISLSEWKEIKEHPEIEVAAPVASLGYFTSNTSSIELAHLNEPTHIEWKFYTSDGLQTYPVTPSRGLFYLQTIDTKELYSVDIIDDISKEFSPFSDVGLQILYPQNYHLLVAIDEKSESVLTGIDFSDLHREFTDEEKIDIDNLSSYRGNVPIVPILQREDLRIPLSLELTVSPLDITLKEVYEKLEIPENESITYGIQFIEPHAIEEFREYLLSLDRLDQETYTIDLTTYQSPFDGNHLILDENFNIHVPSHESGGAMYNDSGKYFVASPIDYVIEKDSLYVYKVKDDSPPQYRQILELGSSYLHEGNAPFMTWQMGTFSAKKNENHLTSSPLGIYSTEEAKRSDGITMTPTITPGSFIAAPAAGVTTLEAAELIKGDRPIDTIRIKVKGITSYNEEAQKRI